MSPISPSHVSKRHRDALRDRAQARARRALDCTREVFSAAYGGEDAGKVIRRSQQVAATGWADYVGIVTPEADLEGWRLIRHDPAKVLGRTKLRLLALFGEDDHLVPPAENVDRMKRHLEQTGNRDFTLKIIPGVGHDMETFGTLRGGEWNWPGHYRVWPGKSPAPFEAITSWMRQPRIIP